MKIIIAGLLLAGWMGTNSATVDQGDALGQTIASSALLVTAVAISSAHYFGQADTLDVDSEVVLPK